MNLIKTPVQRAKLISCKISLNLWSFDDMNEFGIMFSFKNSSSPGELNL